MSDIIKRAQEDWEAEFGLMDRIAHHVLHSPHGAFLRKFADAWLHADAFNKRIIRFAWRGLIDKYDLEDELAEVFKA